MQARNHEGNWVTYLDGQGIDEHLAYVVKKGSGKKAKYDGTPYLTDHLGSVMNSPATGGDHEYGPFGETVHHFEWNPWAFSFHKDPANYAYAGRQFDLESALYYNRARMYDPESGRFLSKDPSGFTFGEINLYRYAENNPVGYADPLGLDAVLYTTGLPWGHAVLGVNDPTAPNGIRYYDFTPKDGFGIGQPTQGAVNSYTDYPLPLIKLQTYKLAPMQDMLVQSQIADLSKAAASPTGTYQYTPIPGITDFNSSTSGKNCWSFKGDACGNVCK